MTLSLIEAPQDLKTEQIKFLYFWVHPDWDPIDYSEFLSHKEFMERLVDADNSALVQIPCTFYFSRGFDPDASCIDERSIEDLKKLNEIAFRLLGYRYEVWDNGNRFIDCKKEEDLAYLVKRFSLERSSHDDYLRSFELEDVRIHGSRHLARVWVYGKMYDTCNLAQAYMYGLNNISASVVYIPAEQPRGLKPVKVGEKRNYVEGITVIQTPDNELLRKFP